jgi:fatty-acyl-CoA synthase
MTPLPSYVHGAHDVPLIGATIGDYLDTIAARFGANEALVVPSQGVRWTYTEFNERVTRLAAGLVRLGLLPGDRVGIWYPTAPSGC